VKSVDEIAALLRRNIQKTIALDGLLMELRGAMGARPESGTAGEMHSMRH